MFKMWKKSELIKILPQYSEMKTGPVMLMDLSIYIRHYTCL